MGSLSGDQASSEWAELLQKSRADELRSRSLLRSRALRKQRRATFTSAVQANVDMLLPQASGWNARADTLLEINQIVCILWLNCRFHALAWTLVLKMAVVVSRFVKYKAVGT